METYKSDIYEVFEHKVSLRSILKELSRKELINLCRRHNIRGYSRWDKKELMAHIFDYILSPAVIYNYFMCMNDDEIEYVRMAADYGGIVEDAEPEAFSYMIAGGYAGFTRELDFGVPYEVLELFESFYDDAFEEKRRRICLIGNYSHVANYLYGVTPPMKVVKMFNHHEKKKTDWCEVMGVYETIAKYRCDFIYKDDYFVDTAFKKDYKDLLSIQGNIPYYIPNSEELEEWFRFGFTGDTEYILELYRYMTGQLWMSGDDAADICFVLENIIHIGCNLNTVFEQLQSLGAHCRTRRQSREFKELLGRLLNSSRMVLYRGYTPSEAERLL